MSMKRAIAPLLLMALVLAACIPPTPPPADTSSPEATPPAETPQSGQETQVPEQAPITGLEATINVATTDLARRLGVPVGMVQMVQAEEMTWPDASLGCPQPGMAYAQMLTDGVKVTLQVNDEVYDYHGRNAADIFLCGPEGPVEVEERPMPRQDLGLNPEAAAMLKQVIGDMAERLSVAPEQIEVISVEAVQWPNSGLGCPNRNAMTLQVITPGYKIMLASGNNLFEYHTGVEGRYTLCAKEKT